MLRAGMVDAEIAARLNISTTDVKVRIERLARHYGVEGREGLRASSLLDREVPAGRGRSRARILTRRFAPYLAVGLVCAVLGAALARAFDSSPAAAPAATATVAPAMVQPTAAPQTVTIGGRDWVAAGRFFFAGYSGDAPVAEVSSREEFAVVTLANDGFVRPGDQWTTTPANGGGFGGSIAGLSVVIWIRATEFSRTVVLPDAIAVAGVGPGQPRVIVEATERVTGRAHPVLVNAAGEVFIDPRPARDDVPIDYDTGEALNLGSAMLVGNLGPAARGAATNRCVDEPACRAVVVSTGTRELLTPSAGSITCPDPAFSPVKVLTFESVPFTVHFRRIDMAVNGMVAGDLRCLVDGAVRNGVPMLDMGPRYQIDATDLAGNPVSVVVDWNGNLWAGDIKPKFGCPCRPSN